MPEDKPSPRLSKRDENPTQNREIANIPTAQLRSVVRISVDQFPDKAISGNYVPATLNNVAHLLKVNGINVRYNVITKNVEILIPNAIGTIDNADNVAMTHIISLAAAHGMATSHVPSYVDALADANAFNPVAEWIRSKPWDGVDRQQVFYETITEQDDYPVWFKHTLMLKWLLSAVAAILLPTGFRTRGVLTLQGDQGIGKTSWLKSLVPDPILQDTVVKVDHHLDSANKDTILGAIRHWLVEIGEVESSFKRDISRLKGFLTSDVDKVRQPYGRREATYPRRTVFMATVNDPRFLVDTTGNSRWWTIRCASIDFNHGIDMQQLFAQLATLLDEGAEWWLNAEEEAYLDVINQEHNAPSVIRDLLLDATDPDVKDFANFPAMTCTEVLREIGIERPTNPQTRECGAILRQLFGKPKRINGREKWRVPLIDQGGPVMPRTGAKSDHRNRFD